MGEVYILIQMVPIIMGNGNRIKSLVMVYMSGKMAVYTKEHGLMEKWYKIHIDILLF